MTEARLENPLVQELEELERRARSLSARDAVAEVEAFFDRHPEAHDDLAAARPDIVGELDGAPWQLRVRTNRARLERDRDVLRTRFGADGLPDQDRLRLNTLNRMLAPRIEVIYVPEIDDAGDPVLDDDGLALPSRQLVEIDRQFLSVGSTGDGRAVELYGNLSTAENVVYIVHGIGVTIDDMPTQTSIANNIHTAIQNGGATPQERVNGRSTRQETATLLYVYDGPNTFTETVTAEVARREGDLLARCMVGVDIQIRADARTTAFSHSYGTRTLAEAIRDDRANVDRVIWSGSPGLGDDIHSIEDLNLREGTLNFGLRAPYDPVSISEGHGRDPVDFEDVTHLATVGDEPGDLPVKGHESFWRYGSETQKNIGRVGRGEPVTTTTTSLADETRIGPLSWGTPVRSITRPLGRAYRAAFEGTARAGGRPPATGSLSVESTRPPMARGSGYRNPGLSSRGTDPRAGSGTVGSGL
ncbi:alpha/beta hydrolase [Kribbella sp. NPDC026611]|uniref:alpha/beta hydrolase n=1 Tax=Kribbella sp. NPDC026611 TaxID=3154911 RepID=UPI0033DF4CA9